jgi:hypothetical protein
MINITNDLSDAHKKISQRGNYRWDHWETHGEAIRQGYPGTKRCTQEISRHHK